MVVICCVVLTRETSSPTTSFLVPLFTQVPQSADESNLKRFSLVVFTMLRCLLLTAACIGLQLTDPTSFGNQDSLPFGLRQAPFIQLIKWGLGVWATVEANAVLNAWAENRWAWRDDKSSWHWPSEIAVVTGGSAGIGACVVKKLAAHGVRVAVLDIGPLSDQFTEGEC